jgi:hypothetical protein
MPALAELVAVLESFGHKHIGLFSDTQRIQTTTFKQLPPAEGTPNAMVRHLPAKRRVSGEPSGWVVGRPRASYPRRRAGV